MAPRRITITFVILVASMVIVTQVSTSPHESPTCPIIPGFTPTATKPGADLILGLMLDLHVPGNESADGGYTCDFDADTVSGSQKLAAAIAATENFTDSIELDGLSVGLEVYDMCNMYDVALFSSTRYAAKRYDGVYKDTNDTECTNATLRLGVIGFERSSWSVPLSNLLEPFDIPVMDSSSTSTALSNKDEHPNFFRVIPPDDVAIQSVVGLLKSFGWTYTTMIYNEGDAYGLSGLQALTEAAQEAGICLSDPVTIPEEINDAIFDDIVNHLIQRNMTVVVLWASSSSFVFQLFEAVDRIGGAAYDIQWIGGDTAGFIDFMSLSGDGKAARGLFVVSPFVRTDTTFAWLSERYPGMEFSSVSLGMLINVVHAYMDAFSLAHRDKCDGQPGMCDALASIQGSEFIEYVKRVNFTGIDGRRVAFDGNGNPVHRYYEILQYKSTGAPNNTFALQKVGDWTDTGLTLNKSKVEFYGQAGSLIDPLISTCEEGSCSDPRCQKSDIRTKFVIEGLFDLYGSECDALRESRFTQVEAALYAVNQINQDSSLLPDIRLSMTVNDICGATNDAERVALRSVQRWDFGGGFPSQDDDSYLMGMLHSGSSGKAIAESNILQIADLPLIASSATSPALSNKDMFGNFLRTVPSDTKQAAAMADLLASLGLTYIQTINTVGVYGDGGVHALKEAAKKAGICIANSFAVDSTTNFTMLLDSIMAKPEARTLVLFVIDDHAQDLFQEMFKRNVEPGQFQILASDSWGTKMDFIPGLEAHAVGALTVSFKTSTIPEFENYLVSLTPETEDGSNPFFSEYWMQKFKCDLPGGDPVYNFPCTGSEMLQTNDVNSLGTENIINVIHVYAVALSNLINSTCPDGGICDALYDVTSEKWLKTLQAVDFVSPVGSQKRVSFDENGDGTSRFSVHQLTKMNGAYRYEEIGTWAYGSGLSSLAEDLIDPVFSSQCSGICLECIPPVDQTSPEEYLFFGGKLDLPVVLQLSEPGEGVKCGPAIPEKSLVLESLLYALDKFNNDSSSALPGVQIGLKVMDSCGSAAVAIRRLVGLLGYFIDVSKEWHPFVILGPANPDVTEGIASVVAGPSSEPLVSHGAPSPDLDNYPLVLSTSAPYINEVSAVVEILKAFDWKYVGVAFSDTSYGRSNFRSFKMAAQETGICLGAQHYIDDTTDFDAIIGDFSSDDSLNVIVAFVNQKDARNLLIADELKRDKKFTWVGTDAWDSPALVSGLETTANGMLVVANEKPDLPEMDDYFSDLDLLQAAIARNPYLKNYLEQLNNCGPTTTDCQFEGKLQESLQEQSGEISALVNAFYAVAYGAKWLHDSKCGVSSEGLCKDFHLSSPTEVLNSIKRVTLESGAGGKPFSFDGRSVPALYTIKNYWFDGQNGQFVTVGEWRNNQLTLQKSGVALDNPDADRPQSDPSGCSCYPMSVADNDISIEVYSWVWINYGIWATIVLALSAICGVLALGIGIVFLSKRHSYVVQSASFSLSMWLLSGIILMYLLNLAYMFEVNPAICGIRRFGTSFVYCVAYAAMVVKSIRANRFARKKPGVDLNFAGSWSQSLLFLAFLLPEIFLVGEWLVLIPPVVRGVVGDADTCGNGQVQMICTFTNNDLTIFMAYAYFLVLITFLFSIGALGASSTEHEGKSIFLTSLFNILILIAWACVYNIQEIDPMYGIPAISIGLTADATIILVFMFLPKLGTLTKKENPDDTGAGKKNKHLDAEDKPEKVVNMYNNFAVARADEVEPGDEVTQF